MASKWCVARKEKHFFHTISIIEMVARWCIPSSASEQQQQENMLQVIWLWWWQSG
jgi:hypothetical protein